MKLVYTFIFALFWSFAASAQAPYEFFYENFGTTAGNLPRSFTYTPPSTFTLSTNTPSIGAGRSGGAHIRASSPIVNGNVTYDHELALYGTDVRSGFADFNVTWEYYRNSSSGNSLKRFETILQYRVIKNGTIGEWTDAFTDNKDATGWTTANATLPDVALLDADFIDLRWLIKTGSDNKIAAYYAMDDIKLTAVTKPTIRLSHDSKLLTPSFDFDDVPLNTKGFDNFNLKCYNLTSAVRVSSNNTDKFKVSLADSKDPNDYLDFVEIEHSNGLVDEKIYVMYLGDADLKTNEGSLAIVSQSISTSLLINATSTPDALAPLPVELASFSGQSLSGTTKLLWTTATELNNDKFVVERSQDGKNYSKVGEVKGNGNSSTKLSYSFTDSKPASGTNYYRLRQVDFDGTASYSNVVALEVAAKAIEAAVYPTVASSKVTISLQNTSGTAAISIVDATGRTVATFTGVAEREIELPVHSFRNGVYFVRVTNGLSRQVQRFIKE